MTAGPDELQALFDAMFALDVAGVIPSCESLADRDGFCPFCTAMERAAIALAD